MSNHDFTLKSGAKLHITTAPFEEAVTLVEAVKKATFGFDPSVEIGEVALINPDVRKALYPIFNYALYDTVRVSPALFDDPKVGEQARSDYFEICSRLIEVNAKPFFLTISSASMASQNLPIDGPKQP